MNKPAPKEPSMDEILSSIRQIIADDDAAGVPRRPSIQAAPPPMQATPARPADSLDRDLSDMLDDIEPLALSAAQIVEGDDDVGGFSFDSILADTAVDEEPVAAAPQLVDPEDITFDVSEPEDDLPAFDPPPMAMARFQPEPEPEPAPAPRARAPIAQAAPLPDPTLSSDMADQLLEPATQAAVRSSITKLNGLGLGNAGATIESLMRDMLRPMLKEWLDENLPAVVERMVEKEIARVSRGE
ncbi:PopZ family protein [Devosia sp.]|uniref:PopZ family protein n=1 Tax=Devosia sp. TaxID=1871048 RepID=UPI002FC9A070